MLALMLLLMPSKDAFWRPFCYRHLWICCRYTKQWKARLGHVSESPAERESLRCLLILIYTLTD